MNPKFPHKLNPKFAELVGVLLGDGCIGRYKCKRRNGFSIQHLVQVTCNSVDDKEYIEYLENLFVELFNILPNKRFREEKVCDLRIFSPQIFGFLVNDIGLKISPKWNKAKIPRRYLGNDLELQVLKGYFDTDGSVVLCNNNGKSYPRLEMKVCHSPMQNQFIAILKRHGFRFGAYQIGKGEVRIQLNGKEQLHKWFKEVGSSNQKHIRKMEKLVARGGSSALQETLELL